MTFVPFQTAPSFLVTIFLAPSLALVVSMLERAQSAYPSVSTGISKLTTKGGIPILSRGCPLTLPGIAR